MVNNNLDGKTCVVTGATSGIGLATAHELAKCGAELFLICRNRAKGERVVAEIAASTGNARITLLIGDLSSLAQVRRVAQDFIDRDKPLHLLLNNAGVFNFKRIATVDGFEEMFAVNHLAHFLLTNLLLGKMGAGARVVNVASGAHMLIKGMNFEDLNFEKRFRALKVYSHSKLANILFTRALAKQNDGRAVTANAVDPGAIATGLAAQNGLLGSLIRLPMKPFLKSPQAGAATSIYACLSPELDGVTGRYLRDCREDLPKSWAMDDAAAEQLWTVSAKLTSSATTLGNT